MVVYYGTSVLRGVLIIRKYQEYNVDCRCGGEEKNWGGGGGYYQTTKFWNGFLRDVRSKGLKSSRAGNVSQSKVRVGM